MLIVPKYSQDHVLIHFWTWHPNLYIQSLRQHSPKCNATRRIHYHMSFSNFLTPFETSSPIDTASQNQMSDINSGILLVAFIHYNMNPCQANFHYRTISLYLWWWAPIGKFLTFIPLHPWTPDMPCLHA